MKTALTLLIPLMSLITTGDISMAGIKIGDNKVGVDELKLECTARDGNTVMYKTANGNDFSLTLDHDKVVYMENDWLQDPKNNQPLFSDFLFGQTTLADIRTKFATNGFTYAARSFFTTDTHLIAFNCFEFDSRNDEVIVTITKIALDEDVTEANLAGKLKLDALIIADKDYLDETWGKDKVFDANYKKIKL